MDRQGGHGITWLAGFVGALVHTREMGRPVGQAARQAGRQNHGGERDSNATFFQLAKEGRALFFGLPGQANVRSTIELLRLGFIHL